MNKENHNCKCNHDHDEHEKECCCNGEHDHNHECGCDHDSEHNCGCGNHHHDTITLTLDNDTTLECTVLGVFDVEDKEYIALLPQEQDNVLLYHFSSNNGEDVELTNIEDDNEFDLVSKTFLSLIEDEENQEPME
jgi:uncharacterized protein YrzB (UPF0473 family)